MKYVLVATLTEYCSCNVYTGLLEPIRHSNIAPMGLSNEAGLSVDCGGSPHTAYPFFSVGLHNPHSHPRTLSSWVTIAKVARCRRDKNSVSSPPLEPCFDVPNNSPNHLLNSLLLCLEKLAKKSSNQTTHLFSCQNSL